MRAENLFLLAGLAHPIHTGSNNSTDLHPLQQYDAINLFVEHAQRVNKQFLLADEATVVIQICQLLEVLPLGTDMAVSYVQQYDCATILAKLTDNLTQIQSPFQDVPQRHRSLSAVFAFSWVLLPPSQQRILAQCAISQGGFS